MLFLVLCKASKVIPSANDICKNYFHCQRNFVSKFYFLGGVVLHKDLLEPKSVCKDYMKRKITSDLPL